MHKKKYNIGIALSGGGIKGICHAGALKAFEEVNIRPNIISGVNAGAIVGALYSDGYTPDEIVDLFDDVSFHQFAKIQLPQDGFFSIETFKQFLSNTIRSKTFEELQIPLRIVATDFDNGCIHVFSSGNLINSIIASCSLPILFKPIKIDGTNYVDGGVLQNFPVSTIRNECKTLIGVNASPFIPSTYKKNIYSIVARTYQFMSKSNILGDKEMCDILIEPKEMSFYDTFDTDKCREIFMLGYKTTQHEISKFKF